MTGVLENPENEAKYFAMYVGVVINRADPDKLGRVKFRIPGLIVESAWAFQGGAPGAGGGGTGRRGLKWVPKLDAHVCVWFHQGDIDHPFYLTGNWGAPDDKDGVERNESPGGGKEPAIGHFVSEDEAPDLDEGEVAAETTAEDDPDILQMETDDFHVMIDEREGKRRFQIRHKKTGDNVEYDVEASAWLMRATTSIDLQCLGLINIQGNQIQINGRLVRTTDDPI